MKFAQTLFHPASPHHREVASNSAIYFAYLSCCGSHPFDQLCFLRPPHQLRFLEAPIVLPCNPCLDHAMSSDRKPSSLMALKAKKAPPTIIKRTVKVAKQSAPPLSAPSTLQARAATNGVHRKDVTPRLSSTPVSSRPPSKEPIERIKKERANQNKRPSPAASTPHFTSSDDDEDEQPKKRARLSPKDIVDPNRRIRDLQAFSEGDSGTFTMVHAAEIANSTIVEHSRDKYEAFFTALTGEEDECPTIELQIS